MSHIVNARQGDEGIALTCVGHQSNPGHPETVSACFDGLLARAETPANEDAGGGTRTPDTRIMIPLL
jgi:hypothetical protein